MNQWKDLSNCYRNRIIASLDCILASVFINKHKRLCYQITDYKRVIFSHSTLLWKLLLIIHNHRFSYRLDIIYIYINYVLVWWFSIWKLCHKSWISWCFVLSKNFYGYITYLKLKYLLIKYFFLVQFLLYRSMISVLHLISNIRWKTQLHIIKSRLTERYIFRRTSLYFNISLKSIDLYMFIYFYRKTKDTSYRTAPEVAPRTEP